MPWISKKTVAMNGLRERVKSLEDSLLISVQEQAKSAEMLAEATKALAQVMVLMLNVDMRLRRLEENAGIKPPPEPKVEGYR